MLAELVVIAGPDAQRTFPLADGQTLVIGRGGKSNTRLSDPQASRVHCVVDVDGGKFLLRDQRSMAGTFVNGRRVEQCELMLGDVIRVGQSELRLALDRQHDAATAAPRPAPFKPAVANKSGAANKALAASKSVAANNGPAAVKPVVARKPVTTTASLKDLVGQRLAHFELRKVLAGGTTGLVFEAHDRKGNRQAAVKVLWPEFSTQEDEMRRFVRSMRTMMPVRHENLVEIYAAGRNGPCCWVAMELVDGECLSRFINQFGTRGMLDWRTCFLVAVQLARALATAYEHRIVHRNIAPHYILFNSRTRQAKLGGLMLAKALEGTLAREITRPGQLVGDLPFMPPERTRSDAPVDCRADIYSLGATIYALLTGRPPYEGNSVPEVVARIRTAELVKPKRYHLSVADRFQDAVLTMLAKRPEDRYETPPKLLIDLDRIARYENIRI